MIFLDKIGKFAFFCGGHGDLLLGMSTLFPLAEGEDKPSIIVWANNASASTAFLNAFPDDWFNKKIVFNRWQEREMFDAIVNHKNYLGKGHIPDNFDFVGEWSKNPEKYLDLIKPGFGGLLKETFPGFEINAVGLSLWGSKEDTWKKKWVTQEEFIKITAKILKDHPSQTRILFGSQKDREDQPYNYAGVLRQIPFLDYRSNDFKSQFIGLNSLSHLYSTDTWQKTWTGLTNIPTTVIRNEYLKDVKLIFPSIGYDPADSIFLNPRFGFEFTTFEEICNDL